MDLDFGNVVAPFARPVQEDHQWPLGFRIERSRNEQLIGVTAVLHTSLGMLASSHGSSIGQCCAGHAGTSSYEHGGSHQCSKSSEPVHSDLSAVNLKGKAKPPYARDGCMVNSSGTSRSRSSRTGAPDRQSGRNYQTFASFQRLPCHHSQHQFCSSRTQSRYVGMGSG